MGSNLGGYRRDFHCIPIRRPLVVGGNVVETQDDGIRLPLVLEARRDNLNLIPAEEEEVTGQTDGMLGEEVFLQPVGVVVVNTVVP